MKEYELIKSSQKVKILPIFCPICGGRISFQLGEDLPVFLVQNCMYCKRELFIKFDLNRVRIEAPYGSS